MYPRPLLLLLFAVVKSCSFNNPSAVVALLCLFGAVGVSEGTFGGCGERLVAAAVSDTIRGAWWVFAARYGTMGRRYIGRHRLRAPDLISCDFILLLLRCVDFFFLFMVLWCLFYVVKEDLMLIKGVQIVQQCSSCYVLCFWRVHRVSVFFSWEQDRWLWCCLLHSFVLLWSLRSENDLFILCMYLCLPSLVVAGVICSVVVVI